MSAVLETDPPVFRRDRSSSLGTPTSPQGMALRVGLLLSEVRSLLPLAWATEEPGHQRRIDRAFADCALFLAQLPIEEPARRRLVDALLLIRHRWHGAMDRLHRAEAIEELLLREREEFWSEYDRADRIDAEVSQNWMEIDELRLQIGQSSSAICEALEYGTLLGDAIYPASSFGRLESVTDDPQLLGQWMPTRETRVLFLATDRRAFDDARLAIAEYAWHSRGGSPCVWSAAVRRLGEEGVEGFLQELVASNWGDGWADSSAENDPRPIATPSPAGAETVAPGPSNLRIESAPEDDPHRAPEPTDRPRAPRDEPIRHGRRRAMTGEDADRIRSALAASEMPAIEPTIRLKQKQREAVSLLIRHIDVPTSWEEFRAALWPDRDTSFKSKRALVLSTQGFLNSLGYRVRTATDVGAWIERLDSTD